ncbi:MAG: alanine--tRNA ligase [Gammaproteobacteria bacterium]|nr:alanine--tRNA ligase [Gammaproteobacteria bacterium]
MKSTSELRADFLDYFKGNGHEIISSSSLVPENDSTLLFTNAGMVQFKDLFLGREKRSYTRAASAQRCVRAGGKHNDLENVGYTARHHTFFEMLGNFSFGDYFKHEAIHYAWEFLTQVLRLPPERLWITVYEQDDEAADIWLDDLGVDKRRFRRIGAEDNFWAMGETGPCGPCSEIFYDHGPQVPGGPPGSPDADGDRYVEIWNLVFTQFNRDKEGELHPLPKPSVDTGMGLERLAAIMQGVHNNYDIDLFQYLIRSLKQLVQHPDPDRASLQVIADHIRASGFLVADGVYPANEGRGYVLRRIIRRAARHGHSLGLTEPFIHQLVQALIDAMGSAYPELVDAQGQVERIIKREEERFSETLEQGLRILEEDVSRLAGAIIPGETIFKLYDTYGFPVDLTVDIARERGLGLDMEGFERQMAAQRERARRASRFEVDYSAVPEVGVRSEFTGYERLRDQSKIILLLKDNKPVERLNQGEEGGVVIERTPYYAESGGQVGDVGVLESENVRFEVHDTQQQGDAHVHLGILSSGSLSLGDMLNAEVDAAKRQATILNHSATHLLHAALRKLLGCHVTQKGSLVAPDRLRFDFSHSEPISREQLVEIEELVNGEIRKNAVAQARIMPMDDAMKLGAMALFGEKYGEQVRVLSIGNFSVELCGGIHVSRAGDIGLFKIISESGVAAGIRRIEALTGTGALTRIFNSELRLGHIAGILKTSPAEARDKVGQLVDRNRVLERELDQLKSQLAQQAGNDLASQAIDILGVKVLACRLEGVDSKALRETLDRLKDRLGTAAIVLAAVKGKRVSLVAGVTKDKISQLKATDLVNVVAQKVGGRGGGRPDMAQAGGNNPDALAAALKTVPDWVRSIIQ